MRRRTLLGGSGSVEYVFSAQSTSVSISYGSSSTNVNIKSTADGTNIGYSVVDYDGTVITSVTTAATRVTIRYSTNSTYDERNGNVVLMQNDSNKTITINLSQSAQPLSLSYDAILLDGTSGSNGSIPIGSSVSFSNVPSWADVTYSDGKINATALSTNNGSTRIALFTVSGGSSSAGLYIIQLPSDYHSRYSVSMGGTNWAIKNVGASSVQDYGNYYQWGAGAVTYQNTNQYHTGGTDSSYTLPSDFDTATQELGSGWRMPTYDECQALTGNSYFWVSYNGVNGTVFENENSGNVLFFPAAGRYYYGSLSSAGSYGFVWSSTPYNSSNAYDLGFYSGNKGVYNYNRDFGYSVRGVQA